MRSSFSQNWMFHTCPKIWYNDYIAGKKDGKGNCYMHAGKVVHKCLDLYFKNKTINIEDEFNKGWEEFGLDSSALKYKKKEFFTMLSKGKSYDIIETEKELSYSDALAFVDGVTKDGELVDWKTGQPHPEHVDQLLFYAMLFRRNNRFFNKARIVYLKQGIEDVAFDITDNDIQRVMDWHFEIQKRMDEIVTKGIIPECECIECDMDEIPRNA